MLNLQCLPSPIDTQTYKLSHFLHIVSILTNPLWTVLYHDRLFLIGGLLWLVLSFGASVMRIFSLQILGNNTYIEWLTLQNLSNVTDASQ